MTSFPKYYDRVYNIPSVIVSGVSVEKDMFKCIMYLLSCSIIDSNTFWTILMSSSYLLSVYYRGSFDQSPLR